ncbi:MAG TPA: GNAT family N-acetyltransferase [Candidatus Acidoferrales bacterium]|nr:GNAT family N-acetyltransferase [Candidatus Acidoferrales bacterium]
MTDARAAGAVRIRRAEERDAAALAVLATQLGYPTTPEEALQRLRMLSAPELHAVFVAETAGGAVAGWVHVSANHLIESEARAEVNGLIVDERHRSAGAGKLLLDEAERWAREHGCSAVNLRSNVIRERAHQFYLRNGYEHYKTQKAFRKKLRP